MTLRIGKKITKRGDWSVEHQQAVLFPFRETISSGEVKDAPQLLARQRPVSAIHLDTLISSHPDDPYSAAADARFEAEIITVSLPIRFESGRMTPLLKLPFMPANLKPAMGFPLYSHPNYCLQNY
jgi:hypothetical protein